MASFNKEIKTLLDVEGKYSNDSVDVGGETYCGVSRKYHPNWFGWSIIDRRRSESSFPACLDQDEQLGLEIRLFYKQQYWDLFWGDHISNDKLAKRMLNVAVHVGVTRAVEYLQRALNILNRNEMLYLDILDDGVYGPVTHSILEKYIQGCDINYLLKAILIFQGMHYLEYMRRSPTQEKFARGWLNRLEIEVK